MTSEPLVLSVADELGGDVSPLRQRLLPLLRADVTVVLDLRRLSFLGPAATRLLLDAHAAARRSGARLVLWGVQGQPLRVLYATRLEHVLERRSKHWRPRRATSAQRRQGAPEAWVA